MGLRNHLDAIRDEYGELHPQLVVDVARPKSHPLHDRFEWDNRKAGEAYRCVQAHRLIQAVQIEDLRHPDGPRHLRAFVAVPRPDGPPDYRPLEEVAEDPFISRLVLQDAERQWKQLYQRYSHLADFIKIVSEDIAGTG